MTSALRPRRRVTYELKAAEGPRLVRLLSGDTLEEVMSAAPGGDHQVLSIWAVPDTDEDGHPVAVRHRGQREWTPIATPREET